MIIQGNTTLLIKEFVNIADEAHYDVNNFSVSLENECKEAISANITISKINVGRYNILVEFPIGYNEVILIYEWEEEGYAYIHREMFETPYIRDVLSKSINENYLKVELEN